eukprot:NODE_318_length_2464_cov_23.189234_g295_i0.p1 GENE.NODE_318_length_2464_cov_23.189234_g295_i0~~NODE_318_length_2464_cov_23.189234_g295_i0.p1  ORF type:complete len:668 (+),score=132.95 NODE_318_length_2464_cov_23.189234_g295_i0:102-2105(+)
MNLSRSTSSAHSSYSGLLPVSPDTRGLAIHGSTNLLNGSVRQILEHFDPPEEPLSDLALVEIEKSKRTTTVDRGYLDELQKTPSIITSVGHLLASRAESPSLPSCTKKKADPHRTANPPQWPPRGTTPKMAISVHKSAAEWLQEFKSNDSELASLKLRVTHHLQQKRERMHNFSMRQESRREDDLRSRQPDFQRARLAELASQRNLRLLKARENRQVLRNNRRELLLANTHRLSSQPSEEFQREQLQATDSLTREWLILSRLANSFQLFRSFVVAGRRTQASALNASSQALRSVCRTSSVVLASVRFRLVVNRARAIATISDFLRRWAVVRLLPNAIAEISRATKVIQRNYRAYRNRLATRRTITEVQWSTALRKRIKMLQQRSDLVRRHFQASIDRTMMSALSKPKREAQIAHYEQRLKRITKILLLKRVELEKLPRELRLELLDRSLQQRVDQHDEETKIFRAAFRKWTEERRYWLFQVRMFQQASYELTRKSNLVVDPEDLLGGQTLRGEGFTGPMCMRRMEANIERRKDISRLLDFTSHAELSPKPKLSKFPTLLTSSEIDALLKLGLQAQRLLMQRRLPQREEGRRLMVRKIFEAVQGSSANPWAELDTELEAEVANDVDCDAERSSYEEETSCAETEMNIAAEVLQGMAAEELLTRPRRRR